MKRKFSLLTGCIIAASVALACLNEHHVDKQGRQTVDHFTMSSLSFPIHDKERLEKDLADDLKSNFVDSLWTQNSIAVTYIKLGRLQEAETLLNKLLKQYPKDYSLIINLGTLYELQGKNKLALDYIKKAMTIDPESHGGSEWFHVKVLEFKLKNIQGNKIVEQDILKLASNKEDVSILADEIAYQLQERIPFTPAPDLMMAKILQEYGDLLADSVSIKGAYVVYEIGMQYDSANLLGFRERRDALLPYFKKYKETVPLTRNYYADNIIATVQKAVEENGISLLEKGISYLDNLEEQRKQRERKKRQQTWLIIGSIAVVVLGAFLLYRKNTRNRIS